MSKNLYEASHQWAVRPDDERFDSLASMYAATKAYAQAATTAKIERNKLKIEAGDSNLALVGTTGAKATLTHYSFSQLSRLAGAPPEYLRTLPMDVAALNINVGLQRDTIQGDARLLFHKANGSLVTRAITSTSYDRIWNHEVVASIQTHLSHWQVPPARPCRPGQKGTRKATEQDILPNQGDFGLRVKIGDDIAPAGLYASDHDMFAFLVNQVDPVFDGQKYLNKGVFIQNSEVGDCALKFKLFTYDNVCGNHIVWGVGEVRDISIRHIQRAKCTTLQEGLAQWEVTSKMLPDASTMQKQIHAAQVKVIATDKEDVINAIYGFAKKVGLTKLSKTVLDASYTIAENTPRYGPPNTVWGLVNGITEYSQNLPYTDERNEIDTQAGRLMEIAF